MSKYKVGDTWKKNPKDRAWDDNECISYTITNVRELGGFAVERYVVTLYYGDGTSIPGYYTCSKDWLEDVDYTLDNISKKMVSVLEQL